MAFADELRTYLEAVGIVDLSTRLTYRTIDNNALLRRFLERLGDYQKTVRAPLIARWHEEWRPEINGFAEHLEGLPPSDAPTGDEEAQAFAGRAFDAAIGLPGASLVDLPLIERLEMQRVVGTYRRRPLRPAMYAKENGLVTGRAGRQQLTGVGQVLARLRGKDAVRWILVLETIQSQGPDDPWRISRSLLEQAMSSAKLPFDPGDDEPTYSWGAVERGVALGVLRARPDSSSYDVPDEMRGVVRSAIDPSPWRTAVGALLDDERGALLPSIAQATTFSDATVEQGRMFAHEARNALVPARYHLDAVISSDGEIDLARVASARRNVVQLLHFVEQMVATGELITERATEADLGELVAEALGQCEGAERVEAVDGEAGPIPVRTPRAQLVLAIANVVRNALQATAPQGQVRIRWWGEVGIARIDVDDDGPGVPAEDRVRIFDDGFTTRPGGTGFGLAYVKKVVGTSLRGKVWCERGDFGGARFSISIPSEPIP